MGRAWWAWQKLASRAETGATAVGSAHVPSARSRGRRSCAVSSCSSLRAALVPVRGRTASARGASGRSTCSNARRYKERHTVAQAETFARATAEATRAPATARELYTGRRTRERAVVGRPGAEVVSGRCSARNCWRQLSRRPQRRRGRLATSTDAVWRRRRRSPVRSRELGSKANSRFKPGASSHRRASAVRPIDCLWRLRTRETRALPNRARRAGHRGRSPHVRVDNALLLFRYGHWPEAHGAQAVFDEAARARVHTPPVARAARCLSRSLSSTPSRARPRASPSGAATSDGGRADVRRRVGRSALPGADRPPSVCAPASCSRNAPSTSAGPERVHLASAPRLLASVDGDPIRSARRRLICCARVSPTQRARGSRSAHLHGVSRFGAEEPRAVTASPTRSRACSASRRVALHDEVVHCARLLGATHHLDRIGTREHARRCLSPWSRLPGIERRPTRGPPSLRPRQTRQQARRSPPPRSLPPMTAAAR